MPVLLLGEVLFVGNATTSGSVCKYVPFLDDDRDSFADNWRVPCYFSKESEIKFSTPWIKNEGDASDPKVIYYRLIKNCIVHVSERDIEYFAVVEDEIKMFRVEYVNGRIKEINGLSPSSLEIKCLLPGRTGIPRVVAYNELSLGEVYPGVEIRLKADKGLVEQIFLVNSYRALKQVKMRYGGVDGLKVNEAGELEIKFKRFVLKQSIPRGWDSVGRKIRISYIVDDNGVVGFDVNPKKWTGALTIDPVLEEKFFEGMSGIFDAELSPQGDLYLVTGVLNQWCSRFQNKKLLSQRGISSLSLCKFSNYYSALLSYNVVKGNVERVLVFPGITFKRIAIYPNGDVLLAGETASREYSTLMRKFNSYQKDIKGDEGDIDIILIRLSSDINEVKSATFFGGSEVDDVADIGISKDSFVYIAGYTWSGSKDFPMTYTLFPRSGLGYLSGYIACFDPQLSSLVGSVLIGRMHIGDPILDIGFLNLALGSDGDVYLGGYGEYRYLYMARAAKDKLEEKKYSWGGDIFIYRFNHKLNKFKSGIILGGREKEELYAMRVSRDSVYVAGLTLSPEFMCDKSLWKKVTVGSVSIYAGAEPIREEELPSRIFIIEISKDLKKVKHVECIGGCVAGGDAGLVTDMVVDEKRGKVYVSGCVWSSDFPSSPGAYKERPDVQEYINPRQPLREIPCDGFISRFSSDLSKLEVSTFYGDKDSQDWIVRMFLGRDGLYICGNRSPAVWGVIGESDKGEERGSSGVFIVKFDFDLREGF